MKRRKPDPMLVADVAAFLYLEARLLDQRRFTEWLDLLDEGIRYHARTRELVQGEVQPPPNAPDALSFDLFNDDKASLKMRVDRVLTGLAHSDIPLTITQHVIGNVEAERIGDGGEVVARSKFVVVQARPGRHEGNECVFFGDREDRLRPHEDSWLIVDRELSFAHSVLPRAVSIIF